MTYQAATAATPPAQAGYWRGDAWVELPRLVVAVPAAPELGRILGPRGELLRVVRPPARPVGFRPGRTGGRDA